MFSGPVPLVVSSSTRKGSRRSMLCCSGGTQRSVSLAAVPCESEPRGMESGPAPRAPLRLAAAYRGRLFQDQRASSHSC